MTAKDWLTLTISCVALFVAVTTATFNVVLQLDDVRVVIGKHPIATITDEGAVGLTGNQEFTFINSGTRAAAITSVGGMVFPLKNEDDPYRDCNPPIGDGENIPPARGWMPIGLDAIPLVLKPGDISVVAAKPGGFLWRRRKDGTVVFPGGFYRPKDGDRFLVCLTLSVVTPDNFTTRWYKPAFVVEVTDAFPRDDKELFEKEKPIVVVRRISTVFQRYAP